MTDLQKNSLAELPLRAELGLTALSGILLTASMPGFDFPYLGWIALELLL